MVTNNTFRDLKIEHPKDFIDHNEIYFSWDHVNLGVNNKGFCRFRDCVTNTLYSQTLTLQKEEIILLKSIILISKISNLLLIDWRNFVYKDLRRLSNKKYTISGVEFYLHESIVLLRSSCILQL